LDVSHNKIQLLTYHSDKESEEYRIYKHTALQNLDLSYNVLTHIDLSKQWTATPSLRYLNLSNNPLSSYTWDHTAWKEWYNRGFNYTQKRPIIDIKNTLLSQDKIKVLISYYTQKSIQTNIHIAIENTVVFGLIPALGLLFLPINFRDYLSFVSMCLPLCILLFCPQIEQNTRFYVQEAEKNILYTINRSE
jgi:hypothetical protein